MGLGFSGTPEEKGDITPTKGKGGGENGFGVKGRAFLDEGEVRKCRVAFTCEEVRKKPA
jgi:hypothetical protein